MKKHLTREEMVERLHWLATKRIVLLRGLRIKRMKLRLEALSAK